MTAASNGNLRHPDSPRTAGRKTVSITAVEEEEEDVIPGPPPDLPLEPKDRTQTSNGSSSKRSGGILSRVLNASVSKGSTNRRKNSHDDLQLSFTEHQWAGQGILASRADLDLPPEEFAAGCNLLQAAARGDQVVVEDLLKKRPKHVDFRDYDRRTALHVAASEGHLHICKYLIEQWHAKINRSDRWGGSPLDDAHRHRHQAVISYLRTKGATTGSGNRTTNLITAAANGDADEVKMLLHHTEDPNDANKLDVNKGDYDKRTAMHLAAGEGHAQIIKLLCEAGADVNVEDRWSRRPLDDAIVGKHQECINILKEHGAVEGARKASTTNDDLDNSNNMSTANLKVNFEELQLIDQIGAGAFGEIYKCRWRGTLVAAKIIKTAKIRRDWVNKNMMEAIRKGKNVDDAIKEMDEAEMAADEKDLALADFRQEISVLKTLRHPHIVLLLAYSTTENYEVMISELMKCSLLDVFKAHMVQGTRMPRRRQIVYATQLALGMNYLHTCTPPIIHRDLKPANLLIDHSGVLKISDFGLSKVRPDPAKQESDKFVMTGETGSYRFMAPEVFRHQHYTEVVDVYSFAMIFFYILVGRPPWPHLPGLTAVKKASEEGDRPNIPRDLDLRLQNLLKECWDDNPSVRPPFSRIIDILSDYNRDVFHLSKDDVAPTAPLDSDVTCDNCIIL